MKRRSTLKGVLQLSGVSSRNHVSKKEINPEFDIRKCNQAKLAGNR